MAYLAVPVLLQRSAMANQVPDQVPVDKGHHEPIGATRATQIFLSLSCSIQKTGELLSVVGGSWFTFSVIKPEETLLRTSP